MVSSEDLIYGVKFSSVVPATVTGENAVGELRNMDLAMKLHYLRIVYYFQRSAVEGQEILSLKKPMFRWLEIYNVVAGRIRRENGRPFIKCNDSGVRIIEAKCDKTLEEWLGLEGFDFHRQLVPGDILSPDLRFCPLVLIQFTWFKCGGMSVGLSWSHVLGDPFSASNFINMWGELLAGNLESHFLHPPPTVWPKPETPIGNFTEPRSLAVKPIESTGDCWKTPNNGRMETVSFLISATQMKHLQSRITAQTSKIQPFEALSALIWQCLAKIRNGNEPQIVTICRKGSAGRSGLLGNELALSTVKADFSVVKTGLLELATMISEAIADERKIIEEQVEREMKSDFVVYGGNLTFVNLEEMNLYGLKLNGNNPIFVSCRLDGVGPAGVVLVVPSPENVNEGIGGRTVTVTLPENEIPQLRNELHSHWSIS